MRRFILIDPSLSDWTGHCAEYALRVLRAASKTYEPILIAHRKFSKVRFDKSIKVIFLYRRGMTDCLFDWYQAARALIKLIRLKDHKDDLCSPSDKQSLILKAWQRVKQKINQQFQHRKADRFAKKTRDLCQRLSLTANDIIFIPNMQYYLLLGLIKLFRHSTMSGQWHSVFHLDLCAQMNSAASDPIYKIHARDLFKKLCNSIKNDNLFLYTDTDLLTHSYNDLGVFVFKTIPIPVCRSYAAASVAKIARPLTMNYLGVARDEKGYRHCTQLIELLRDGYLDTGKLVMNVQSSLSKVDRDPVARSVCGEFKILKMKQLNVITQSLSSHTYRDYVLSSNIALIPYDACAYAQRSSSVFAECMAAGIPVIIPAGTWMAVQLNQTILQYHLALVDQHCMTGVTVLKKDNDMYSIPSGATHMLLNILRISNELKSCNVTVTYYDKKINLNSVVKCRIVDQMEQTILLKLQSHTQFSKLQFQQSQFKIQLHFLRLNQIPISVVGVVYQESWQLKQCVQELVDYYPHYKNSALLFSKPWSAYHNPDSLLQILYN